MTMELDKATRLAIDANVKEPILSKVERWFKSAPPLYKALATLFLLLALGGLAALVWWEGNNAGQGFQMLGKGIAAPWIAYIAGFGCTVGCIAFFRVTMETIRDHAALSWRVIRPAVAAVVLGLLSAAGTFANLVDNASSNQSLSMEQQEARGLIEADVRRLKAEVETFREVEIRAGLESDQRTLAAYLAEAKGWKMANLDVAAPEDAGEDYPGPACDADLKDRQRQLCNMANHADGPLASIAAAEAALEAHENAKVGLRAAKQALALAPSADRAQFWDVASQTFSEATHSTDQTSGSAFMVLMMLGLTIGILLGTCFGCEAIFEHLETRAERKAKGLG